MTRNDFSPTRPRRGGSAAVGLFGPLVGLPVLVCAACAALSEWEDVRNACPTAASWKTCFQMSASTETGEVLVTGTPDVLRTHALADGRELLGPDVPADGVTALACSPVDAARAVGYRDGSVWVVRGDGPGMRVRPFDAHDLAREMAFSSDGRRLAWGTDCGRVEVCDLDDGSVRLVVVPPDKSRLVQCLAFAPQGATLLVAGSDGSFSLWDTDTGTESARHGGYESPISAAAFGPDGEHVYTTTLDGRVACWGRTTGVKVWEHRSGETFLSVAVAPHGRHLVCGSVSRLVQVRDSATGEVERTLPSHRRGTSCLQFLPASGHLVSAGYDGQVFVWDVGAWTVLRRL